MTRHVVHERIEPGEPAGAGDRRASAFLAVPGSNFLAIPGVNLNVGWCPGDQYPCKLVVKRAYNADGSPASQPGGRRQ